MKFSWDTFSKPIVALAPLAGYTDSAYRRAVKLLPGTENVVCFSELTSVAAIHHKSQESYRMLDWHPQEFPLIMQLFGKEPEFFVESGKMLEDMGIAGIDINMGCPTCKVTSNECGSALLKSPDLAAEIVYNLSRAVSVPVSVKTRLGYECYDEKRFLGFCKGVVDAGAKLLSLHGRTRTQAFSGEANWDPIYLVKKELGITILGNGDIKSVADAEMRLGNLDGVMVGRATLGDPWLIAEIAAHFKGVAYERPKNMLEKMPLIRQHVRFAVEGSNEVKAIRELRKHLASYIKGFEGAKKYVEKIMQCDTLVTVEVVFDEIEEVLKAALPSS